MRKKKPRAYLSRKVIGHFMFEPTIRWVAVDDCRHQIAMGKTRKECESECRMYGYVPVRY